MCIYAQRHQGRCGITSSMTPSSGAVLCQVKLPCVLRRTVMTPGDRLHALRGTAMWCGWVGNGGLFLLSLSALCVRSRLFTLCVASFGQTYRWPLVRVAYMFFHGVLPLAHHARSGVHYGLPMPGLITCAVFRRVPCSPDNVAACCACTYMQCSAVHMGGWPHLYCLMRSVVLCCQCCVGVLYSTPTCAVDGIGARGLICFCVAGTHSTPAPEP